MRRLLQRSATAACSGVLALCACSAPAARDTANVPLYRSPVVLFVSPDSQQLDAMQQRLGDDFYVVADDAMWYRSQAYELLDSLALSHEPAPDGVARFVVDDREMRFGWRHIDRAWFVIVYDGRSRPVAVADIELRRVLLPSAH